MNTQGRTEQIAFLAGDRSRAIDGNDVSEVRRDTELEAQVPPWRKRITQPRGGSPGDGHDIDF